MKSKFLILLLSGFILLFNNAETQAQCTIDSSQTQPGLHPDTLADGEVNQFYDQDVSFVMITDTLGLTITNFLIQSINGLPLGMNWTCNHAANGCNYNPNVSLYGCVQIYGTPLLQGVYPLSVTVVATVQFIGNQTFNFNTSLTINPASISNNGFSMNNAIGCAPLTVGFTNLLNNPQKINWNFGNGDSSTAQNPGSINYNLPGDYVVTQTSISDTVGSYYLSNVAVDSIPNAAGFGDVPDLFILVKNASGVTVYDSHPALNNTAPPASFSIPSLSLNNQNYTIEVWDEDTGFSAPDDALGTVSFNGNGSSGVAYATLPLILGRLKVRYTIVHIPSDTLIVSDTVHVFPVPPAPTVSFAGPTSFCDGDTLFATASDSSGNQWYKNGNLLVGETQQTLSVTSSGNYYLIHTNAFGCGDTSAIFLATAFLPPPYPLFSVVSNTLTAVIGGVYNYQWYLNDTLLPADTNQVCIALVSGDYSLQLTDTNGCQRRSFPIGVIVTGINEQNLEPGKSCYPNPAKSQLNLITDSPAERCEIYNAKGKLVYSNALQNQKQSIQVQDWPRGIYVLRLFGTNYSKTEKLILD